MAESINKIEQCPGVSAESQGVDLINRLNNDCLRKIFLYLPPGDKLNAEKVCKRWRAVAKRAWNNVKYLDFTKSKTNTTDFDKLPADYKNIHSIAKIILRCGRYLDGLKLGSPCHRTMIPFVAQHCQNLIKLEVLFDWSPIWWDVSKMMKLRYFSQKKLNRYGGGLLRDLPSETLTELHLHGEEYDDYDLDDDERAHLPEEFDFYFQDLENVTVMSLHNFELSPSEERIINQNTNLTFLSLANCIIHGIFDFSALINLEHLNLDNIFTLDVTSIVQLSRTCKKLKYLNLDRCSQVTNDEIMSLWELPQLEELSVNHLYDLTDEAFIGLRNLKKLSCENCRNVEDGGVLTLMRIAPNLESLNLRWTIVTHEVLIEANEITKRRTNGLSLRMVVGSSVMEAWIDNRDSPSLIVESIDDASNPHNGPRGKPASDDDTDDQYDSYYEFEYNYESESDSEDGLSGSLLNPLRSCLDPESDMSDADNL